MNLECVSLFTYTFDFHSKYHNNGRLIEKIRTIISLSFRGPGSPMTTPISSATHVPGSDLISTDAKHDPKISNFIKNAWLELQGLHIDYEKNYF